ncbi:DDE-type integrase/transposase/recombinase [Permianibacter aggregans]|uniref:Mu transposase-like protein n=1 Tax=Permianibacter aggregans TaxID=1510150 RepID=A0A4R6V1K7_9GAMM|nr:DDE-type integrase/transposase/recombinase [Permianibacter aggregans]QGX39327.1 transposase [Permianibacter aggregans]TDQ49934.1 Mu transposase-like protein [Permianibacter aggregans]
MITEKPKPNPPLELRLRVLSAIDYAPGDSIRERIKAVSQRAFVDHTTGHEYHFTWRTIETWRCRFKKHGLTTLDNQSRRDKNTYRKVKINELAEAITEVLPSLRFNKTGVIPKSALYRKLLQQNYFSRYQLSPTTFYRLLRENDLLNSEQTQKLRQSFAMRYANELWQADTMHGPSIKQPDGKWRKTFLIAFIDDASRVITHAEFFYADNTENMIDAFKSALFKRGKPQRLYFDNGSNYTSKEMLQACLRLDIHLSHAPVRDGAAKGKIERFFRGFRDRFLTQHLQFDSLDELNDKTHHWLENDYNNHYHSGIQMTPLDRFNLDRERLQFLTDDEATAELFFVEETRKVSKTNVFSINNQRYECPVDLREKSIQVRFDRSRRDQFIVYYNDQRIGPASLLDLHFNARQRSAYPGDNA